MHEMWKTGYEKLMIWIYFCAFFSHQKYKQVKQWRGENKFSAKNAWGSYKNIKKRKEFERTFLLQHFSGVVQI
jgi:hypothetical protein